MSKEQVIIHYRTAIFIFQKWHEHGVITREELEQIDTIIARKYDLSLHSIYR